MARRYSEEEIDEYVLADQLRRSEQRTREMMADPRYMLCADPDWPELGLVWVRREDVNDVSS